MSGLDTIMNALSIVLPTFNKSDGTIEAKVIDVVGTYADTETIERENTVNVINEALASQRITKKDYFRNKSVQFQIGDIISYDPVNQGAYYATVNEQNRIIKQSYIVGSYPTFTNLVNAVGADGHLRELTTDELNSFRTYFQEFQPLGLNIVVDSLSVARITDPNMVIYVRSGTDAGDAVEKIKANLLAYESVLRSVNTVSLTEIEDIIKMYPTVKAIGWSSPVATEEQIGGGTLITGVEKGIFNINNGAFIFDTEITTAMIKTIQ